MIYFDGQCVVFWTTTGPFGSLGNFFPSPITAKGKLWPTAEHLYQASKLRLPDVQERIRQSRTAKEAKAIAYAHKGEWREDWDEVKEWVMMQILTMKYHQSPIFRKELAASGTLPIVERSSYDSWWGAKRISGGYSGENRLGLLLTTLRDQSRRDQSR